MINMILSLFFIFSLVFQKKICILVIQFLIMTLLVLIRKKKIKILPTVFITISLIFFNILSPFGKVWFLIGNFPITEGAFLLGLKKALVLCGMVFISQLATSFYFEFKGSVGKMISQIFTWFNIFSSLDRDKRKKMGLNLKSIDEFIYEKYFEKNDIEIVQHDSTNTKKYNKTWTVVLLILNIIFLSILVCNFYIS